MRFHGRENFKFKALHGRFSGRKTCLVLKGNEKTSTMIYILLALFRKDSRKFAAAAKIFESKKKNPLHRS